MRNPPNPSNGKSASEQANAWGVTSPIPPNRTLSPLLFSFGFHLVLLVILGLLLSTQTQGTTELPRDRDIGIAIVHQLPDRERYSEVQSIEEPSELSDSQPDSSSQSSSLAPPSDLAPPLDLAGVLNSLQAIPTPISGTGITGESRLSGDAFSGAGGDQASKGEEATTMLFGVSGSGTQFVYVFDRSDSMNGFSGRPLRAAKSELINSLGSLTERQQFQIIFYNEQPRPFSLPGVPMAMVRAEPSNLELAKNYIRSIAAYGGTEHESALKLALRMGPDVIFFLTDARIPRLSEIELRDIQMRATTTGTTIHCIEFGADRGPQSDSFLTQLATMNQGQYRYINVQDLKN
jgi:hypothetical protein